MQRIPTTIINSTIKNIFKTEKTQTHILHIFRNLDIEMRYVMAEYYQYLVHSSDKVSSDENEDKKIYLTMIA